MTNRGWDPGAQNERTRLAWQRTILGSLACALLIVRLLAMVSAALAVVVATVALLSAAGLGFVSIRRYAAHHTALHASTPVGDGVAPLLITILVALMTVGAVLYIGLL